MSLASLDRKKYLRRSGKRTKWDVVPVEVDRATQQAPVLEETVMGAEKTGQSTVELTWDAGN